MTEPAVTGGDAAALALREKAYTFVNAALLVLLGVHAVTGAVASLWGEVVLAFVTLIFAAAKATSNVRLALYAVLAPVSALLGWYGIATGYDWPTIAMAVSQVLGITTAASKVVTLPKDQTRLPLVS